MDNADIEALIQHELLMQGLITIKWACVGDPKVKLRHPEEFKLKEEKWYTYEEIEKKFKSYCAKYAPSFIAERHFKLVKSQTALLLENIEKTPWAKLAPELQEWAKEAKKVLKKLK